MNRRGFLSTLFGIAIAPAIIAKVISEYKPTVSPVFKGVDFFEPGIVYAPWFPIMVPCVPLLIASDLISVQPMSQPSGKVSYMNYNKGINESYFGRGNTL